MASRDRDSRDFPRVYVKAVVMLVPTCHFLGATQATVSSLSVFKVITPGLLNHVTGTQAAPLTDGALGRVWTHN